MANPTKPKDAKPKAEADDFEIKQTVKVDSNNLNSSLLPTIGIVVVAVLIIIATNYFLVDMKLSQISQKIAAISTLSEEDNTADDGESVSAERGIILDLGEFILNLADTNTRKFLKVNVAIELSKKESDTLAQAQASSGGHSKGQENSMSAIETEMNQFKPAIRDSIISILSSKTSDELATTPGKELAKEQLKESINAIFEGDREVLRVSFGSFFIQ